MNKLSVVIASYERPRLLKQTIESLLQNSHYLTQMEIVVVDDYSQNEEVDRYLTELAGRGIVKYYQYPVRVPIHTIKNKGFLLTASDVDYIHFSDNDLYYEPDWDSKMIAVLEAKPEIGIIGGSHHPHHQIDGTEIVGNAGVIYSNEQPGYSMLIRKADFVFFGPWFSEQLAGGEDSNFCAMATNAGYKIAAMNIPTVLHCGATGTMGNNAADYPQIMAMSTLRTEVYVE